MIRADFRLFGGQHIHFARPAHVFTARAPDQVAGLLHRAEEENRRGRWVALALSYECAGALDPDLTTHDPGHVPLAWAAVFNSPSPPPAGRGAFWHSTWTPGLTPESYVRRIQRIKRWIARGDAYQINFTFPLTCRWSGSAWGWYNGLAQAAGRGAAVYVDMGRWTVMCLSPELFFEKRASRLWLKPMKGSAPRGLWPEDDRARARLLQTSEKDRAENLMIVDLMRNDAGQLARPGSVKVTRLFDVDTYPTVHQMTSTIEARLTPGRSLADVLRALFPSGSVTGAPKRRAMEIIRSLEDGPRGFYTGALGLLRPNGRWTFLVGIRTITLDADTGRARCPVGSGVTWSSRPRAEYEECLWKARFLQLSARPGDPLETIRLSGGRYRLLEDHMRRLRTTAERFGRSLDMAGVRRALDLCRRAHAVGDWRVRMTVPPGGPSLTVTRFIDKPGPWRVALCRRPIDRDDPHLYHKTTVRGMYEVRRALRPDVDDVLLMNERAELTESTIANLVVELGGRRYTPPVRCGLLPGLLRQRLVRAGRVRERVLTANDLKRAERVWLVNSLRGWMPATVVD